MTPPPSFRPAGEVLWVEVCERPPPFAFRRRRRKGRRRQGELYETRLHLHFAELFGASYVPSQWFRFRNEHGLRWCQPDGLLFDVREGVLTIIEAKYNHTADSWWQLRQLYSPVLARAFPEFSFRFVTAVKWFDPATDYPEPVHMLRELPRAVPQRINLHIWAP